MRLSHYRNRSTMCGPTILTKLVRQWGYSLRRMKLILQMTGLALLRVQLTLIHSWRMSRLKWSFLRRLRPREWHLTSRITSYSIWQSRLNSRTASTSMVAGRTPFWTFSEISVAYMTPYSWFSPSFWPHTVNLFTTWQSSTSSPLTRTTLTQNWMNARGTILSSKKTKISILKMENTLASESLSKISKQEMGQPSI
jgi:hypothetical protein